MFVRSSPGRFHLDARLRRESLSVLLLYLFSPFFFSFFTFFFFLSCYERNFGERATSRRALRGIRITKIIGESGAGARGQGGSGGWRARCAITVHDTRTRKFTRGSSRATKSTVRAGVVMPPPPAPPLTASFGADAPDVTECSTARCMHPCCPFIAG